MFNIAWTKCAGERRRSLFKYAVPRDEAYYCGDRGTNDTYSRREYEPLGQTPELFSVRARVEEATPIVEERRTLAQVRSTQIFFN